MRRGKLGAGGEGCGAQYRDTRACKRVVVQVYLLLRLWRDSGVGGRSFFLPDPNFNFPFGAFPFSPPSPIEPRDVSLLCSLALRCIAAFFFFSMLVFASKWLSCTDTRNCAVSAACTCSNSNARTDGLTTRARGQTPTRTPMQLQIQVQHACKRGIGQCLSASNPYSTDVQVRKKEKRY